MISLPACLPPLPSPYFLPTEQLACCCCGGGELAYDKEDSLGLNITTA